MSSLLLGVVRRKRSNRGKGGEGDAGDGNKRRQGMRIVGEKVLTPFHRLTEGGILGCPPQHHSSSEQTTSPDLLSSPLPPSSLPSTTTLPPPCDWEEEEEIYLFGLIDTLTEFNLKKESEFLFRELKMKIKRKEKREEFSCVPPHQYALRFIEFMERIILPFDE
uniref:PIPK domain-containing protein n=1 Tax=Paramoeba aestuarina TaxID=180227 RepID=A0A7S4K7I1_9EUKA|mmetsp:Transcript_1613/g.2484  ORF Transcript_1613/g.2484 Transcript_1613/m.2484 type:complete len:164 (+) Transcript_1613:571-1062(+)|eukprot:CAMPEP_0201541536 /NCGR_PEP_ID=MMETSP0161_2-20130828/71531_1 /ASSEMBLY_ACC=CAM_ASM_000251 /TAXON_ID=180227 /ORGANISM="Neoparamoeba aestuarina, Strain SoJaBio B1-5/56/2" /LENGTH=163 /DNA_ID=CAMNT_0047949083 /DNA_START=547 /DNA_END=1038 /DNA_ORIENTATION=-